MTAEQNSDEAHICRDALVVLRGPALAPGATSGHYALVRFELTGEGVGPLRVGMRRDDARRVLAAWGQCSPFRRGSEPNEGWVVQRDDTSVFVYCDDSACVDAIEFASPGHGVERDDQVLFDEIDVFIDPADEIVCRLRDRGHRVVDEEGGYNSTAPDVLLALRRGGEPIDDSTELPAYFESALVARPGYYG